MTRIYDFELAYHIKDYKPTDKGLKTVLAAIKENHVDIYGNYNLYNITDYIEHAVPKSHERVSCRLISTSDVLKVVNYIKALNIK